MDDVETAGKDEQKRIESTFDMHETEKALDNLEAEIALQKYNAAFNALLNFLSKSSVHRSKADAIFSGFSNEQIEYIATRFVGAVNFLFLQKAFKLNEQGFQNLLPFQSNYAAIVHLTPFKNCDHIIRRILNMDDEGKHSNDLDLYDFLKLVFLWSPYSNVQLPFKEFLQVYPQYMTPVVLSSLRALNYIEENSHANREAIIQTLAELGEFDLQLQKDDRLASMVGPAWMNVSYATSPNKYDAKVPLNYSYRQWMKHKGINEPKLPPFRKLKDKPVLGIMNEALNRSHAMFRCYGDTIIALREKFHTVGFFTRDGFNDNVKDAFDEVLELPHYLGEIKKTVGKVIKRQPDMLIYTSLGMNNIMMPIANLRIAPIQIAFLGHPNSTRSKTIDYIGAETCSVPYTKVFNEKIIDFGGTLPMQYVDDGGRWQRAESPSFEEKKQLDIAVPSMVMKLNNEFLQALKLIKLSVSRNIRFHFFPHISGITYHNACRAIHNVLPESIVHPPYRYSEYLKKLSECDLHFGPFPFNNSNGNVDSLKAGLPLLVLRGDPDRVGVEGIADVSVLEKSGAPSEMIADNLDEYIAKACKLIENDIYRQNITQAVYDLDLSTTLYDKGIADLAVNAIWSVYQNHESYIASDEKVIRPNAQQA